MKLEGQYHHDQSSLSTGHGISVLFLIALLRYIKVVCGLFIVHCLSSCLSACCYDVCLCCLFIYVVYLFVCLFVFLCFIAQMQFGKPLDKL